MAQRNYWIALCYLLLACHTILHPLLITGSLFPRLRTTQGIWNHASSTGLILANENLGKRLIWNKTYGFSGSEWGNAIVECRDGGFAVIGEIYNENLARRDIFVVRTDHDGNVSWNRTYNESLFSDVPNVNLYQNGEGLDLVEAADGGFVILGRILFDHNPVVCLFQINASGELVWVQTYQRSYRDYPHSLITCRDGGFAVGGKTSSNQDDAWVLRTDSEGELLWDHLYGGSNYEEIFSLIEVQEGGFALAGWIWNLGSDPFCDMWLLRLDTQGNPLWNQTFGGTHDERGYDITELMTGGFALVGYTEAYTDGMKDGWLVITDLKGNQLQNVTFGMVNDEESFCSVVEAWDGGLVILGTIFDIAYHQKDIWVVRSDEEGNHLWNHTWGGDAHDVATGIIESGLGDYAIVGYTNSFGSGGYDALIIRISGPPQTLPLALTVFTVVIIFATITVIVSYYFLFVKKKEQLITPK